MLSHGPIQELPLSLPVFRKQISAFLEECGLRMDEGLEHYYAYVGPDGRILAGAGLEADIIKCVAVSPEARSTGMLPPIISMLMSECSSSSGITSFKVFTKPENSEIFHSLGFKTLARAPKAILMENGRGLENYCEYLRHAALSRHARLRPGISSGVIVMNANPFTLGHKYLIEKALEQVDHLFVIPVKEDRSAFPYSERIAMIRSAVMPGPDQASALPSAEENYFSGQCPKNQFSPANASPAHADATTVISSEAEGGVEKSHITVLEGSSYIISSATFPTYFLKDLSEASETQMLLDLDLFRNHIMQALGATVRFVGSETLDPLTERYNSLMQELIPGTVIIPRIEVPASALPTAEENYFSGQCPKNQFSPAAASLTHADAISASRVRAAIEAGDYATAAALCPEASHPYLLAALAERALLLELNTPMKPGLVGPDGPGAHSDMDYGVMRRGISALRPFWSRMALAATPEELRQAGIDAEAAMMEATGGVNTHRGAIFCLGLALNAAWPVFSHDSAWRQTPDLQPIIQKRLPEIAQTVLRNQQIYNNLAPRPARIKDARAMALDGYREVFEEWLPYYRSLCHSERSEESPAILTLLRIMSTLDDTCIIKRVGYDRAQEVKREAASAHDLKQLCQRYAAERISPGGAADMLALTIFVDSII